MSRSLAVFMIASIRLYRRLRPEGWIVCRFSPSCSVYAEQAVTLYGPWRGGRLAALRLSRCQPFCAGGMDPV